MLCFLTCPEGTYMHPGICVSPHTMSFTRHMRLKCACHRYIYIYLKCVCMHACCCSWLVMSQGNIYITDYDVQGYAFPREHISLNVGFSDIHSFCMDHIPYLKFIMTFILTTTGYWSFQVGCPQIVKICACFRHRPGIYVSPVIL